MFTSWVAFDMWGTIAGLIFGVVLLDFGEQGAPVSNQHIIYALFMRCAWKCVTG